MRVGWIGSHCRHWQCETFKEPVVVDKTAIRVVEGSARPLDNDVLLGQEKLVEKGKEEKASLEHVFFGARENA